MIVLPQRVFSPVLLIVSAALLAAVAVLYLLAGGVHAPGASTQLTAADWQAVDSGSFAEPPPVQDSAALPADWRRVQLPLAMPIALLRQARAYGAAQAHATTWLRLSTRGLVKTPGPLALYGARVKTDGTIAVYANGHLVHQAQRQGPLWNSTRTPLWVVLDAPAGGAPLDEILIRLEHTSKSQVAVSSLWLGPPDALSLRYQSRRWLQQELPAMLSAAFLAVGIFAFFVWVRRRHEIGYLLFFALSATAFLRGLHFYVGLPIANDWFAWLTVNALFWLVATLHFFLRLLHGRELPWLTRGLIAVTVLVAVTTLPALAVLPNTPSVTPLIYAVAALMGSTVFLVGGIAAWRDTREGRLVAVGLGVVLLQGFADWLLQNNVVSPEGWYLGAYSNAVCFAVFGTLMYRRYIDAIHQVELLNASLAQRLRAREAELEQSHQRLREVEYRQTISDERQRLMQDMHDGLGSSLISAIRSVEQGGVNELKVAQILKDCLDDLKLTIDSMEPVEADLLLLLATLRFRLEPRLEGTGIVLLWRAQALPALDWLDPSSALHILRIVQEGIANILRHTHASEILVGTGVLGDGVQISIEDNGQGFDVDKAAGSAASRGLANQRRRAQAVDGTVSWDSGPAGTRFTLWLPLRRKTRAA
ncbi:ATP-binding protein [Duganella sp. Dugasp56]|uniref:sensor histidine kinase n=1 Tax=Duganella sp. Dugasp56 TaxID=3243046 RepID=UPI0039B05284